MTTETHESYGMIGVNRCSRSGNTNLFGSSINHSNTISVIIKRGEKTRDLNKDYYSGRKTLLEVEMSQSQFAEMITSMNINNGVPCTIRQINGNHILTNPPEINQRQLFEEDFEKDLNKITKASQQDIKEIQEILTKKGNLIRSDRQYVLSLIEKLVRVVNDEIPWIQKQFNKAMDKTVLEAKNEVESFVTNKILSTGIKALKQELKMLTGEK